MVFVLWKIEILVDRKRELRVKIGKIKIWKEMLRRVKMQKR